MAEKSVAQKLQIKAGRSVLFINQPQGYDALLGELPANVQIVDEPRGPVDIVQLFVASRSELEQQLPQLKELLHPKSILWVTYYKGTSRTRTDINRDTIYAYALTLGLEGVAMIAVDQDWSALRLKVV